MEPESGESHPEAFASLIEQLTLKFGPGCNTEVIRQCFDMGMGASEMEEILSENIREQSESWEIRLDIDLSDPEPGIVALGEAPHFPDRGVNYVYRAKSRLLSRI